MGISLPYEEYVFALKEEGHPNKSVIVQCASDMHIYSDLNAVIN
jgi:hypothetical protein